MGKAYIRISGWTYAGWHGAKVRAPFDARRLADRLGLIWRTRHDE